MEIQKELKDIALDITEPQYRAMPELSYSNLSTFERLGYDGLDHLFDKIESPSLTFGSVVDSMLTGGEEEFNDNFVVLDINIKDDGVAICKKLADIRDLQGKPVYDSFEHIPIAVASQVAKEVGFWKADKWSDETRYKHIYDTGDVREYYNSLVNNDRKVIDTVTYNDAIACVRALRESQATSGLFADNDELSSIRRYYQLKFRSTLEGVGYRSMMDLIIVDYEDKIIYPYDLKTCGIPEWHFEDNFLKFHYYTQSRLYYRVLEDNVKRDPYFKDFEIKNFKFIVINRKTLTPLVWEFPLTKEYGDLVDNNGNIHKDPFELGKELRGYLDLKPPVPNGIDIDGVNTITCLKKLNA